MLFTNIFNLIWLTPTQHFDFNYDKDDNYRIKKCAMKAKINQKSEVTKKMSMWSAETYRIEHKSDSLEMLIRERKRIFEEIWEYEVADILYNLNGEFEALDSSRRIHYLINNECLKILSDLIAEKQAVLHIESSSVDWADLPLT